MRSSSRRAFITGDEKQVAVAIVSRRTGRRPVSADLLKPLGHGQQFTASHIINEATAVHVVRDERRSFEGCDIIADRLFQIFKRQGGLQSDQEVMLARRSDGLLLTSDAERESALEKHILISYMLGEHQLT
jgi:hypothetical protein